MALKKATLNIKGMHCNSCNILIEDKFNEVDNVRSVKANFNKMQAEVLYKGHLDRNELNSKISAYGYQITDNKELIQEPFAKRVFEISTLAGILFIIYLFIREINIMPEFNNSPGTTLTYLSVFVLGLVASTSTCMATSGALFMATIGKRSNSSSSSNLIPALSFNVGRILSYGFFGFIVGLIGSIFLQNIILSAILNSFIAVAMIAIGLSMTGLINFSPITNNGFLKNLFQKLEAKFIRNPRKTAFFLGAITYLLPCGFTQSVQLYALSLANPVQSAIVMMVFALGTMPLLMALAYTNSIKNYSFYTYFQKIVGIIILAFGFLSITNALTLFGNNLTFNSKVDSSQQAHVINGYQIAKMSVNAQGYSPNSFVVKQNIPVKWIVNGVNVFGCQGFLVAPQLKIQTMLEGGEQVFEFTPTKKGVISFSCSMGMYRGQFNVI